MVEAGQVPVFQEALKAVSFFDPSAGSQTLTYSYTDGNTCSNSAQVTITVNELPVINAGSYAAVCVDAADVVLAGSPVGGTWTGTGVSGSIESGFVFDPSAGSQTLTYSYTDGNTCSNSAQVTITVNDLPVVSAGTYAAVCADAADLILGGTPAGGTWSGNGVSGSIESGFVFDPSTGSQTLTYSYTDGNTCSNSAQVAITVNELPVINAGSYAAVCVDAADVALAGSPVGGSWTGTGVSGSIESGFVFDPSAGSQTLTYSYTDGNTCSNSAQVTITVNELPVINAGSYAAVCIDAADVVLAASPVGGSWTGNGVSGSIESGFVFDPSAGTQTLTYSYTDGNTCSNTAQVTITVNDLPVVSAGTYAAVCADAADLILGGTPAGGTWSGNGVSGSIESGFVFDPSTGSQTLTYSYTDGNTCSNSAQVAITVNELPVINAGSYAAVCVDAADVVLAGSPAGGTWTGTGVSGSIESGFVFDPSAGSQTLTYSYTDGNTCSNSAQVTITVNELPVINAGSYAAVCVDAADVVLAASPLGGSWTGNGVSGSIESGFVFDPSAGTQTLTYSYTDGNTCSNTAQVTITVNDLPVVSAGTYTAVCADAADLILGGTPAGGTWSGNGVSGSIESGFVFDPSTGSQTLTYSYTDGNTCSNSAQVAITVNELPVINAGSYAAVCVDAADVVLAGSPVGGTWTGTGVSGSIESGFVFDPSAGSQTLTYSYTDGNTCSNSAQVTITVNELPVINAGSYAAVCIDAADVVLAASPLGGSWTGNGVSGSIESGFVFDPSAGTQTLTYSYTDGNTCSNTAQVTITVNELPVVSAGTYAAVCSDAADLILDGTPAGGSWSGNGVSGSIESGFVFDPSSGSQALTYSYTDGNTCSNSAQVAITVNELPVINAGSYAAVCVDAADVVLAGSPVGGSWTGTGVSGSIESGFVFDPSAGSQTLTYSYTDGNTCSNSAQVTITVNELPVINAGSYAAVCIDAADVVLAASPLGGSWTGNGVSGSIESGFVFDPSAGTQTLTYSYTDGNTCSNTAQVTITVNDLPVVSAGTYAAVCADAADLILGGTPAGGTWSGNGVSGSIESGFVFDPSTGSQTLSYSYTDGNSCQNSASTLIIVNDPPVVNAGSYAAVCVDAADVVLAGSPVGGSWTGTGVSGSIESGFVFDPSAGTQTLTYVYSSVNGCSASSQTTITVHALPVVSAGTYSAVHVSASPITLSGIPAGGTFSGPGVSGNQFDPSVTGIGMFTITYTYTNGFGCSNTATSLIVVYDGTKSLSMNLLLEGLYTSGGQMHEAADENGMKWGAGIADHITVELHDAANYNTILYTNSAVELSTSGSVNLSGANGIPAILNGSYYITIKHRNSIETTTANPVSFGGASISYSFDAASKAFGDNLHQTLDGAYVIYCGDVNQDGLVDSSDMIEVDNETGNFATGYLSMDVNGDGLVDSTDMILIDNNVTGFISVVLP
ncbi:MAG: hypothetical protein IPH88_06355 [Bacteroidales bacterium]|nr:hypothetical protein [Bacteroidales bacterium]